MAGSANLNVMMKTARKAGRALLKDFGEVENLQVSTRGPGDFVSRALRQAEQTIRQELTAARSTYGFIGADSGTHDGEDPTRHWIVDALGGATNFLHGLPHWCVSVALEHKGQPVAGVVYDPVKDEMFYAEKGGGAFMNESRLRVSGRHRLIECIFATGLPSGGRPDLPATLHDLGRLLPVCAGVRRWGAPALDLAYVAAGRYDGYWERRLGAWDMAAGLVVLREAGGFAEAIRSGGDMMADGEVVCGNEAVFASFAKAIRG